MSGPSGVGKGTIVRELLKACPDLKLSVSCTTRQPRPGETEGVHYFFVSKERFEELAASGQMLEWANVHGNCYGTPRGYVEQMLAQGYNVLLEIDVQGSLQVLENMPETIGIFILPPSRAELVRRLSGRGTENKQQLETRIRNAEAEVKAAEQFPYLIVNATLSEAVRQVRSVIEAENLHDQKDALNKLYEEFEEAHSK
ncbi:MAG: guanylate kinase [Clostridia bacterium]|nr:guanylate kinase [Clostridia bacterium]